MERLRFGRRNEGITRKLGRFFEDHILEADIIDTLLVATILGTAYLLKDYFDGKRVRTLNNIARIIENGNIAPLNSRIVKDLRDIASSKF